MSNNSTANPEQSDQYHLVRQICQYCVLLTSVIGNLFLVIVLIKLRRVRKLVDKLILNLAASNLLLVLVSIPTSLVIDNNKPNYPFRDFGCKVIDPISTYAVNAGVFTLLAIAFERWNVVTRPFIVISSKKKVYIMFLTIHLAAICTVAPYFDTLSVHLDNNRAVCSEAWSITARRIYTVTLFVLQYGLPVPIMLIFYGKAWIAIKTTNTNVVTSIIRKKTDNISASNEMLARPESTESWSSPSERKHLFPSSGRKIPSVLLEEPSTSCSEEKDDKARRKVSLSCSSTSSGVLTDEKSDISPYVFLSLGAIPVLDSNNENTKETRFNFYRIRKYTVCQKEKGESKIAPLPRPPFVRRFSLRRSTYESDACSKNGKSDTNRFFRRRSTSSNNSAPDCNNFRRKRSGNVRSKLSFVFSATGGVTIDDENQVQTRALRRRLNQSRDLLKMFSVVVLVFIMFMLPNQILWLLIDFKSGGDENFNPLVSDITYIFTYANCVLNPWIYGRLNQNFRKDFRDLFTKLHLLAQKFTRRA